MNHAPAARAGDDAQELGRVVQGTGGGSGVDGVEDDGDQGGEDPRQCTAAQEPGLADGADATECDSGRLAPVQPSDARAIPLEALDHHVTDPFADRGPLVVVDAVMDPPVQP